DLDADRSKLAGLLGRDPTDNELAGCLMYPKVFMDFEKHLETYGDVSVLPTSVFFYGMRPGEEMTVTMPGGYQVVVRYLTAADANAEGTRRLFFEINGQPSSVRVPDRSLASADRVRERADDSNPRHVAAPMPGLIAMVKVSVGTTVKQGDTLMTIEAMKMETAITAERDGKVARIVAPVGSQVDAKDLLIELE
ncbi:MAG: biotin/lipoyl-containing protein, partial [Pseudomonadota bacterium]